MRSKLGLGAVAAGLLAAMSAAAHHGAGVFEPEKKVTVAGKVTAGGAPVAGGSTTPDVKGESSASSRWRRFDGWPPARRRHALDEPAANCRSSPASQRRPSASVLNFLPKTSGRDPCRLLRVYSPCELLELRLGRVTDAISQPAVALPTQCSGPADDAVRSLPSTPSAGYRRRPSQLRSFASICG